MLQLALEKLETNGQGQPKRISERFLAELRVWKETLDLAIPRGTREALSLAFPKWGR